MPRISRYHVLVLVCFLVSGVLSLHLEDLKQQAQNIYTKWVDTPSRKEESYKIHPFSQDPLIVYVENFISLQEASQLVQLSTPSFAPSILHSDTGTTIQDPTYRSSLTASLGPHHALANQIMTRARSMPFYSSPNSLIKPLVVQKYQLGNQYKDHYDWFFDTPGLEGNIESTFFVYIEANCTGGGTNFPRLDGRKIGEEGNEKGKGEEGEGKWCEFIDCDRPWDEGITFKPVTGNAIFWVNLKEGKGEGWREGDLRTLHAGLPVTSGVKMGLNIWTWVKKG